MLVPIPRSELYSYVYMYICICVCVCVYIYVINVYDMYVNNQDKSGEINENEFKAMTQALKAKLAKLPFPVKSRSFTFVAFDTNKVW